MATVSLQTVAGAFDESDNLLASGLVRSLEEGASVLTFAFNVEGEIPEGGLIVTVSSNIALIDYFANLGRPPFSPGGQVLEGVYDPETREGIGFRFRIDQPNALISLPVLNLEETTGDPVEATFTLEAGEGYSVDEQAGSSAVTFYSSLDQVPTATVTPEVSFSVNNTNLNEATGNTITLTFSLSEAPPPEGVLVSVKSVSGGNDLSEFDIYNAEITGGAFPAPNFTADGFFFKVTEQTATITLTAFNDGDQEGIEEFSFEVQAAPGYTIAADADTVDLSVVDDAGSQIQVSLTTEPSVLVESAGTVSVHTFSLSTAPPEDGLIVSVVAPNIGEFALSGIEIEGGEIARLTSSGFDFKITAQEATIQLPVANDGTAEGLETVTFTLQDAPTYQVNPNAFASSFQIVDTADQVPVSTTVSEPNDILSLAIDTQLSATNSSYSVQSSIDYESANLYENAGGTITRVDATEDVDFYKFTLNAGETVAIDTDANRVNGDTPFSAQGFNTVLRLFDANGTELALNNNGSSPDEVFFRTTDSYISYTAEAAGTYYVAVSSSNNNGYDPNVPGSGSGNTRGEYNLEIQLNPDAPEPSLIPIAGTPADSAPTVTMETVVGTFDGVELEPPATNPNFDNIVVPDLVQSLAPSLSRGQSLVTFSFATAGEIPSEGVEVFIAADSNIAEFLNTNARVSLVGCNTSGPLYNSGGELVGFKLAIFEPSANASFVLTNLPTPETDGPETVNFTLLPSGDYKIGGDDTETLTIYDSIEQAQATLVEPGPQVGISISNSALVESQGTETTLTFNVDGEIPTDGLLVYVDSPTGLALGELNLTNAQISGGVFPPANFDASGFYFKILENAASVTFQALDESLIPEYPPEEASEGLEGFTYSLQDAPGYTVDADASSINFTIADNPDSQIRVGLVGEPTVLVESEGTTAQLNFSLSAPPPEYGLSVTVSSPELSEFIATTSGGALSSLTFLITEQTATINLPVLDDGVAEALETATFTLQPGSGFEVSPTSSTATFTIFDTLAEVIPSQETESNDTLATANVVPLQSGGEAPITGAISGRAGIDASEDVDLYRIDLFTGQTLIVDVDTEEYEVAELEVPQRLDSELRLFDINGNELLRVNNAPAPDELFVAGRDPYLEFTADAAATYYVGVSQLNNRTYDPFTAGSGSGQISPDSGINTGVYTLNLEVIAVG